jgi:hypothetical protein
MPAFYGEHRLNSLGCNEQFCVALSPWTVNKWQLTNLHTSLSGGTVPPGYRVKSGVFFYLNSLSRITTSSPGVPGNISSGTHPVIR